MPGYKNPDFNERIAAARAAKQSALDKLRDKPAPDPAVIAERQAARAARDAAAAERRAARQRAAEAAKLEVTALPAAETSSEATRPEKPQPSEAERKAARDARYAARKARRR